MSDPVLQLVTRAVFVLVFCLTLLDFLRSRDLPRLEIAAMFGGLVLIIALQALADLTGIVLPSWTGIVSALAVLLQPFLMVRVLGQFRHVPGYQQVIAAVAMGISCVLFLIYAQAIPSWALLFMVVAFAYVEGYATVAFVRSAFTQRGISQWRLINIALGSGCLATIIVLSGLTSTVPSARSATQPLMDILALGSAIGYWVGMAPPRWLRRVWQGGEVRRFLLGLTGLSGGERVVSTLEYLGPAAARATGGSGAIVGLVKDDHSAELDLYADKRARAALEKSGLEKLTFERSWVLSSVWQRGLCAAIGPQDDWGWELRRLAEAMDARAALLAPIRAGNRSYGIFIVFINRSSLFVDDDLAVLSALADQAALALESAKLLEESTRERSTLAAVMSSMHDGLLMMDEHGVIKYCNGRASELLGVTDGSLIGTPARNVFAQVQSRLVTPDAVLARWRRVLREVENPGALEFELTAPARSVSAELFTVAQPDGTRRGVGAVLRDVTVERDLIRTKDELVSVVSHELRTPLASVVGFAELLRTRELSESQRNQFLTVILEEGRRLTSLINDFLDLQRMESGRQEIRPRAVGLAELLEHTVEATTPDPERPIELDLSDSLPVVRVDSDRVQQLLTNLISNARKYSPSGGKIEVSARESDGQVIVSVQDHGLGLPLEALPRLFEKFFRVDNSDRRAITGTGLGLAISRKIIEAHGGHIWAESEGLGHGSRFSFSLPVARVGGTSGDVLIVEDDAGFARLLEAELASRHISTVWVASAEEAVEQLAAERPKAVVLDLLLPGAQGEDFLRVLQAKGRKGWNLPVIVVTVKDLTQSERIALGQFSVQAILRKEPNVGVAAADLVEAALRQHTEGERERQTDKQKERGVAA